MQGFINIPYQELDNREAILSELRQQVKEELAEASGQRLADLKGVLSYLDPLQQHYSEGRSVRHDKQSFAISELQTVFKLPEPLRVKYLMYRYRFNHYPRLGILSDFPIVVCIEPTSVCNLRCVMCFQADKSFSSDKKVMGFMELDLFKKVIDESVANDLCSIVIASRGEPTLHKQLPEMIAYAREKGILDVKLNTNATRLTPELSRSLLKAFGDQGVNTIVFSVDSAEKEEFERIRVGANFDKIVENISVFRKIRQEEFPNSTVRTRISMTLVTGYYQSVEKAQGFWPTLVDEFAIHHANPRVDIYHHPVTEPMHWCTQLFERLYIWYDGTVNTCDEDYKSKLSPGTLKDKSIKELWSGKVMKNYRSLHKTLEKNKLHPCDRCYRVNG